MDNNNASFRLQKQSCNELYAAHEWLVIRLISETAAAKQSKPGGKCLILSLLRPLEAQS